MPGESQTFSAPDEGLLTNSSATPEEVSLLNPSLRPEEPEDEDDRTVADAPDATDPAEAAAEAAELANAATDADREAIRARRRAERKARRQHQKDHLRNLELRINALTQQNQQLQEQMAGVHSMTMGQQLVRIDEEVRRAKAAEAEFQDIIADAVTKGDGRVVAEATRNLQESTRRAEELLQLRERVGRMAQQKATPQLNPAVVANAQTFMSSHKWYKAGSEDVDSRIVTMVDNSLSQEGWDPSLPAYWQELERRAARYLPHRFPQKPETRDNTQQRRGPGGVSGGGSGAGSSGSAGSSGYVVSAERVKAMKEAGIWDDPKRRDAAIKRYQEFDRSQSSN